VSQDDAVSGTFWDLLFGLIFVRLLERSDRPPAPRGRKLASLL